MRFCTGAHAKSLAAAVLVVGLLGCGSGDDTTDRATETTLAQVEVIVGVLDNPELGELVDAVAAEVGDEAVFDAVALAVDRGYAVIQLADAVGTGAISADGTIAGVEPTGEPYGLLVPDTAAVQSLRAPPPSATTTTELAGAVEAAFEEFDLSMDNKVLTGVLVTLVEMGYSLDQIVEGLVLGELTVRYSTEYESYTNGRDLVVVKCLALVDSAGEVVAPERALVRRDVAVRRSFDCGELAREGELLTREQLKARFREEEGLPPPTTEPATGEPTVEAGPAAEPESEPEPPTEMTYPRTYRDEEGVHVLSDFVYDIPTTCPTEGPMELVLAADGTATFTYFNGVGIEATLTAEGQPVINCVARPGTSWTGTFDAELGTIEIVPPVPEGFDTWDVGGSFDAETAEIHGGYSLPPNQVGQQATIEIGADLVLA